MNVPANDHHRQTPLLAILQDSIQRDGPMPVSQYMELCLRHPQYGYYASQTAIGTAGDFITAPEISQIFGELIGLWAAVVWQTMQAPTKVRLVEIGPGRGTLMSDALRAMANVPGMPEALSVHLVEVSPVLRAAQEETLRAASIQPVWHTNLHEIPTDGATILIANEFLDTFPVDQYVQTNHGPRLRAVGLDEESNLTFVVQPDIAIPQRADALLSGQPEGMVAEVPVAMMEIYEWLAQARPAPVVALLVDYGHEEAGPGETLQAVRSHNFEHVLASPGEADLSVQVDFSSVTACARAHGLAVDGPLPQAEFLGQLGILQRASRLMSANPKLAAEIEASVLRLMAPNGMGTRFKAIGLRSSELSPLPGLVRPNTNGSMGGHEVR